MLETAQKFSKYIHQVRKISEDFFLLLVLRKDKQGCGGRRVKLNSLAGRMWLAGRGF